MGKLTPTHVPRIAPVQLAYIAGFIDGDGSILGQFVRRVDYVYGYQIRVTINLTLEASRLHFLKQFQEILKPYGEGTLRNRGDGIAELAFVGKDKVGPLLFDLKDYLQIKHTQAKWLLDVTERLPHTKNNPALFLELCQQCDRIAGLNNSQNSTINADVVKLYLVEKGFISL